MAGEKYLREFDGVAQAAGGVGLEAPNLREPGVALVLIDLQRHTVDPDVGLGRLAREKGLESEVRYFYDRIQNVLMPNVQSLLSAFRRNEMVVVHVRNMSVDPHGRDRSNRFKAFGVNVPPGSAETEFPDELLPREGELVINKTTASAFNSSNLDYVLRMIGIRTVVVGGVATNHCVESTVRDAADLGYAVVLVPDACAAFTEESDLFSTRHLNGDFAVAVPACAVVEVLDVDSV